MNTKNDSDIPPVYTEPLLPHPPATEPPAGIAVVRTHKCGRACLNSKVACRVGLVGALAVGGLGLAYRETIFHSLEAASQKIAELFHSLAQYMASLSSTSEVGLVGATVLVGFCLSIVMCVGCMKCCGCRNQQLDALNMQSV